jgi:hypothetical protein
MKQFIVIVIAAAIITGCKEKYEEKIHYPSNSYEYIKIDTAHFVVQQTVYVPIYSHIYIKDGKNVKNLTATLSVRSTNFSDSIFITSVDYYGSHGKLIKKYLDSTLLLKPINSVEFIVEEEESEGGAGANFIVEWRAKKVINPPLIQAVMLGTYYNIGISFAVDGVPIPK